MRRLELRIDLATGTVQHESGFEDGVYCETPSRLVVGSRISKAHNEFYVAGRFYSFANDARMHEWLERFSTSSVSQWACEADGDFVLLAIDKVAKKAYLVSDRNGAVRTYYALEEETLSISTSRLGLIRLMKSPRISSFAAYQLIALGYVVDPHSLIEKARTTVPGQVISCDGSGLSVAVYYSPVQVRCEYLNTEVECVAALDSAYQRVFQKRLDKGRVPCVLLSGGIDSLTILKYVKALYGRRVVTLTFSLKGLYPNELEPARIAARHLGTEHHELIIDPEKAVELYIRSLAEADTAHASSLLCFAEREYLESDGSKFDVFTGEDTRLHTPTFDFPREIGIGLNLNPSKAVRRALASLVSKLLRMYPLNGSLNNYLQFCAETLTPSGDFRAYLMGAFTPFHLPAKNRFRKNGYFAQLLAELPDFELHDGLQEIFKKYISFEYRAQYTDDMNCGFSSMTGPMTELHHPFYDWECVMASNLIPYRLAMRPILTFRSWSKLPLVYKRIARAVVKDSVPKEVLFRAKKTCPFQHLIFNSRLGTVVKEMLEKWGDPLLDCLDPEVREIARSHIGEYNSKGKFVRNNDEPLLWSILAICYIGVLNQVCADSSFQVAGQMSELRDRTDTARAPMVAVQAKVVQ